MEKYMRTGSRYRFHGGGNRKLPIVILLIVMFGVGFLVSKMTIGGGFESGNYQTSIYQEMRNEAKNAVNYVNKLSRNNGTSSDYLTLAEVKSCLGSLESLNSVSLSVNGEKGKIFTDEELNDVNELINLYYANLTTGTKVTENLTLLLEAINSLYARTIQILGD